jgi:hypothetical protein
VESSSGRPRRTPTAAILALLLFAFALGVARADEVIDRVLAVVAGDLIMQSDVRAARELGLVTVADATDPDRAILSQLVDRALILDEVERYAPPEPSSEAIDGAFRAVRARFSSDDAFSVALGRVGFDTKQLQAILRQNLRIRAYLDQRFGGETPERSEAIIAAWVAGLRSRATIVDLYGPPERPR